MPQESRASLAVTICWMLTMLATGLALGLAGLLLILNRTLQFPPQPAAVLAFLPGLMTLVAAFTGFLCLVLTVVVYRVRRDPPPLSITFVAIVICLLPLFTLMLIAMRG